MRNLELIYSWFSLTILYQEERYRYYFSIIRKLELIYSWFSLTILYQEERNRYNFIIKGELELNLLYFVIISKIDKDKVEIYIFNFDMSLLFV